MLVPDRVRDLAVELDASDGLPAYAYDLGALAAHAAAIRDALPRAVEFYYAVKANPDARVLRTVAGHADGLEVSSGGELTHTVASVPAGKIAFGGPGKTFAELASGVQAGIHRFHVESPHELRMLAEAAGAAGRTARVLLRVNPAGSAEGAALVMGGKPSPFGMDAALLDACADVLSSYGSVRLRGLHAHVASGLDADDLLASAGRLLAFGRDWCSARGVRDPEFNLGGGMAVDYRRPDSVFDWAGYGRGLAALLAPGETLRIEPGRAVSAYCGWYLSRVLDVKGSHGEAFAVIAGGTHHLRTPAAKGHDQPFSIIDVPDWAHAWERPGSGPGSVTVCGQLCTPKDVLASRVQVPGLRAGDLVAFGMAGAYAWNISHHSFLMHPQPSFHYL
ncbi:MAG TPA: alanine racemase [Streptosporangiaceae bacterium]